MVSSETAIANLVYLYAERIDAGDLEGAAALFANARIKTPLGEIGADEVLAMWRRAIILYEDGTPRTKHVITNPIIEVDEHAGTGSCRSTYTVMQQAGDGPLQLRALSRRLRARRRHMAVFVPRLQPARSRRRHAPAFAELGRDVGRNRSLFVMARVPALAGIRATYLTAENGWPAFPRKSAGIPACTRTP